MAYSIRTISIGLAILLALGFMTAAFLASGGTPREAGAEGTEELLKAYAEKDSDADGLPDWEEALYGTDPNDAYSVKQGMNDGAAVAAGLVTPRFVSEEPKPLDPEIPGEPPAPASLTEEFSRLFLEKYLMTSGGQPMSEAEQQALVANLTKDFGIRAAQKFTSSYTLTSVRTSGSVSVAAYAVAVERVVTGHSVQADAASPIPLMEALLVNGDESARAKLRALASAYKNIATQLVVIEATPSLAGEHLKLVRSFDSLSKAFTAVAEYEKDPLAVLGAIALYQPSARSVLEVYAAIGASLIAAGEPAMSTPGPMFVEIHRALQAP